MALVRRDVVFIGCDHFGFRGFRELLALQNEHFRVAGLITGSDAASLPLRAMADGLGLPVVTDLPQSEVTLGWLEGLAPDFGVVMEYGHKLSTKFLQKFSGPVVNFHPSDLPEFRGGAPMESLITEQRPLVISSNKVSPKFDDGPILGKTEPFDIAGMELDVVYRLAAHLVLPLLRQVVTGLVQGDVRGMAQDESRASYRWYKDLEHKLAIGAEDTVSVCERKLLASNPKHGIALNLPALSGEAPIRVSAGFGLRRPHDYSVGAVVDASDDVLTVAVKDGLMTFYGGTVGPGEVNKTWQHLKEAHLRASSHVSRR